MIISMTFRISPEDGEDVPTFNARYKEFRAQIEQDRETFNPKISAVHFLIITKAGLIDVAR